MASPGMLRRVGVGKRDLRSLIQRQHMEDQMDLEEVALRADAPVRKKKKKRASLLRATEQCSAVLAALRHIMDDNREDSVLMGNDEMDVDSDVDASLLDVPMDGAGTGGMEEDESLDELFPTTNDPAYSGRYVIPSKPQNTVMEDALSVPVLRKAENRSKRKRRKRKRELEAEKVLKCNSLPLGFKIDASKTWEVDSMTVQLDSMRIRHRGSHKRSPSQGSPETETKHSHQLSVGRQPPSKKKAVSPQVTDGHKRPANLPRLRLSDIPRESCKMQYSPDLSKSCIIISPRSAFSRSPRSTSPVNKKRHLSPVNSAHQRPALSPSPRTRSPLSSPIWTPRSTARMTSALLHCSSPTAHQNSN